MDYYDHKKVVTEDGRQNLVEFSLNLLRMAIPSRVLPWGLSTTKILNLII